MGCTFLEYFQVWGGGGEFNSVGLDHSSSQPFIFSAVVTCTPVIIHFLPTVLPTRPASPLCPTVLPTRPAAPLCPTVLPTRPAAPLCPTVLPTRPAAPLCPTVLPTRPAAPLCLPKAGSTAWSRGSVPGCPMRGTSTCAAAGGGSASESGTRTPRFWRRRRCVHRNGYL